MSVRTFELSPEQKEELCVRLKSLREEFDAIKEYLPILKTYNDSKILNFLEELRVLTKVDALLKENLQPCLNPYEEAIDAVGVKTVSQNKEFSGESSNTSKINMKPGVEVADYVRSILRVAKSEGKPKAVFTVHNRSQRKVCVVPVRSFEHCCKTYINWDQFVSAPGAKIINV